VTDAYGIRRLDIDESNLRYTLTVYQPGLAGALTHWLGEIDNQRRAHRKWAARWKASGHTPPTSDPYRPHVDSGLLVFLELAGPAGAAAAATAATGSGWALLVAAPVLLAGRVADLIATRRCARALTELRRTVSDPHEIVAFARAVAARRQILADWPKLGPLGAGDDPRGPLDRALWDLAGVMHRRAEVRATGRPLDLAAGQLPADDPAVIAVELRRDALAQALRELTADITDRLARLDNLAAACCHHLAEQAAIAQARQATAAADAVLGASAADRASATADPYAEVAERTAHVLAAYRQLRRDVPTVDL
jgi:hypothetical protein